MNKKLFIALILSSVSGFVIAAKHHKETQNPSSQKTENPLAHLMAILPDRVIQKLVAASFSATLAQRSRRKCSDISERNYESVSRR